PPQTPAIYPLSLHDALPICVTPDRKVSGEDRKASAAPAPRTSLTAPLRHESIAAWIRSWSGRVRMPSASIASAEPRSERNIAGRSEEHTSELQSLAYLVCRL